MNFILSSYPESSNADFAGFNYLHELSGAVFGV